MGDDARGRAMSRHFVALGAGVQSTCVVLMAKHGLITPMPEAAIFADTQGEPERVYKHFEWLVREAELPFPVYKATAGNLAQDAADVRVRKAGGKSYLRTSIPVFTINTAEGDKRGMSARRCTTDYKIRVVNKQIRRLLGVKRVTASSGIRAISWLGISADEASRMKPSRIPWIDSRWPLIELGMSRGDCLAWLNQHGYPEPPRSACTFCPFHSDDEWLNLTGAEFETAVLFERALQDAYKRASITSHLLPFLHDSRVPLDSVRFVRGRGKAAMTNECEGMCGI